MLYKPFLGQDYEKLKAKYLKLGNLFEDDKFPALNLSLFRKNPFLHNIVWKRPHEFIENARFIVDNIVSSDLDQGQIGNCWVIASFAAVLNIPQYQNRIVPHDQTFDAPDYAGIFHFRFWFYGEWVDVVVDDRLPIDAKSDQLTFCRNKTEKYEMFEEIVDALGRTRRVPIKQK